ncbi:hypothetical protein G7054_g4568 [Neopestalotiopsis clavispora]|nr:hypothetical protein G7054_g4568 [Neopestalotiopsis clavispora]
MSLLTSLVLSALGLVPIAFAEKLLASHYTGQVYSLDLAVNGSTGTLKSTSSTGGCGKMPTWLELDSDTGTLYCFDESGAGQQGIGGGVATTYTVNTDGSLKQTGQAKTKGGEVHGSFYGGSDGRGFVATVEYDASTLTTFKLPLTSSTQALQTQKFNMSAPGPNKSRQTAPHPHSVITDPTGKYLIAPDLGADLVRIFSVDATSGQLTACAPGEAAPETDPVTEPARQLGLGVEGHVSELGLPDAQQDADPVDVRRGQDGARGLQAAEVHVSGNFLYAVNRNDKSFGAKEDSIVTYSIDAASGAVAFVEATNAHAWYPRTFAINKAGTLVAVGGQTSSNVAIIQRDAATGKLGDLVANLAIATPGTDGGEDGLSAVIWDE